MRALCLVAFLAWTVPAAAQEPAWRYPFQPGLKFDFELVGTYESKGLSTQRIVPQGDSGGGPSISANGGDVSSGSEPPFGTHDGRGSASLRLTVQVDEVAGGKATCSVTMGKMAGKFDAPGMAGRCFPLAVFLQIHGKPFRAVIADDGGLPDLPDFEPFVRDQLGAEVPEARIAAIVRETKRAIAACFPALPEPPGRAGASYRAGDYAFKIGPQKIVDGKKTVLVAGDAPKFEREREEGKIKIQESGGSWARFYYAKVTAWSVRYEERHWRDWSKKARTALGQRTDMTEVMTYAASLKRVEAAKPPPEETPETPETPEGAEEPEDDPLK